MTVSKRVSNAKSERHYKTNGPASKKKQVKWYQNLRKQITAHPLMIAFIMFITVFSGVFSFFMNDRRLAFGNMGGDDDDI